MSEHILIGFVSIIVLGIFAQWLAWRLSLPAILVLLIFGIAAGPVAGILNPDEVFGELLFPVISVSVALILFEGSLRLKFRELQEGGPLVARLTSFGIIITWVLAALGAYHIMGFNRQIAVLLGAVLTVTGPTVIIPLLRQVRPVGMLGSVAKWEGIVNDPIGAILAVLTYEIIVSGSGEVSSVLAVGVMKALVLGSLLGLVGAALIVILLRRYLIPDFLQNPMATMLVVIVFVASNAIQSESGLLAVTVMGVALANQRYTSIRHLSEFKESLQVLLIASLFIILAARLPVENLQLGNWQEWVYIALLILVIRPAAIFAATIGAGVSTAGRVFLSWLAPRGIVAAAVVSVFALRLEETGIEGVDRLVPLMFKIIFVTVMVYGITVPLLARRLGIAKPNPQGVLFGGAQPWVREVAQTLAAEGIPVALVDSNWVNVTAARQAGLTAHYGNLLSEDFVAGISLEDIGSFVAVTPNDEVNSLAAISFAEILGRSAVYQLLPEPAREREQIQDDMPSHLRGRLLFGPKSSHRQMELRQAQGAVVKRTRITEDFTMDQFWKRYGDEALPLFVITPYRELRVVTANDPPSIRRGDSLVSLVRPGDQWQGERPA